ncbi:hypothetical protein [Prevotella histicola]|jgi:hypothetical protein|uniref:Uncharacterized protein n=1 Tax=Prevotella histicola JCM 15637 = DNF00424 TaxID=1236504 RepID=A0AAW3FC78_9BACT|nr:hypothetical protein [Prevotella histicola]KGF24820.1 hypothetical protein HMPREF2132_11005 [Prevotella histicola JCM 15637 = DNF00424]
MSKDFNLPPVDVMEAKTMEIKIYHFYPLILKRFEEFKKENLNVIKGLIQRLKKNPPSIKLEDYMAIQIASSVIGDYDISIWINCYLINKFHLMAVFKKALKDSGISKYL